MFRFGTPLDTSRFFQDLLTQDDTSNNGIIGMNYVIDAIKMPEPAVFFTFTTFSSHWHLKEYPSYGFVLEITYVPMNNKAEISHCDTVIEDGIGNDATFLILWHDNDDQLNLELMKKFEKNIATNESVKRHDNQILFD